MPEAPSLSDFWDRAPEASGTFPHGNFEALPELARRYLSHAIAPDTPLANAVRLRMHGHIKLNRWLPFTAEQVIRRDRGMIWRAKARVSGIPVSGYDRLVDGRGAMRWRLMGILPVMQASGPDISRSAAGRMMGESMWLPSMLCARDVAWHEIDDRHVGARLIVPPDTAELELEVDASGALRSVRLQRWGNPGGAPFGYVDFGGIIEEEGVFEGFTIPTRLRGGWQFDGRDFAEDGEFFRATIDQAIFR